MLPTVVVEIVLGILIGPQVLGWATVDSYIDVPRQLRARRSSSSSPGSRWSRSTCRAGRSCAARSAGRSRSRSASRVGYALHAAGLDAEGWLIGGRAGTTALGTLVPILADAGLLPTPLGRAVLGTGVAGEFWPIVVISVFLTGVYGAATEAILLVVFGVVVAVGGCRRCSERDRRGCSASCARRSTRPARPPCGCRCFALAALVLLASDVGFDFVLGAFAAGLIVGLVLDTPEGEVVRMRLEGIGFGFLIPIYFVVTGMNFDLDSLLTAYGLVLAGAVPRPAARRAAARRRCSGCASSGRRTALALALFGATGLPLIVAIVGHRHGPRRDRRRASARR